MTRPMKDSGVKWIGKIPIGWSIRKVKSLYSLQTGFTPDTKNESYYDNVNGYDWITIGDLNGSKVIPEFTKSHISQEYVDKFSPIPTPKGSLLYSFKLSVGQVAFADRDVYTNEAIASFINDGRQNLDYFYYSSYMIVENANDNIYGAKILNQDLIRNAIVTVPPLAEQQRIAHFLDVKCSAIDDVLTKTQESIEEYKKLKQAVITEAVTKGVRGKRPMKDSGIEWIGQIPKEWNVQRIKTIFDLRTELNYKPLEEVNLISLYTDKGVVQHSDLDKTTGNKAMNADGYKIVRRNDIVVNIILCWMGAIGRSDYDGVTSPAYDVYRPKKGIECKYYHHLFRTAGFNGDCFTRGRGIMLMRWRTYSDEFRDIRVVVPSLSEQKEIVEYLDKKCDAIDTLIEKKQQFIEELTAYKKSLIYEYVTGKKEVPA